jgi:hypothetical protein
LRKIVIASGMVAFMAAPAMAQGWYVMKGSNPGPATGDATECYAGERASAAAAEGAGETLVSGPYRTQAGAEAAKMELAACPANPQKDG